MTTAYITHEDCKQHDTMEGHPEAAERIGAIEDRLMTSGLMDWLRYYEAPKATREQLARVHRSGYIEQILSFHPDDVEDHQYLDSDTVLMEHTPEAALRSAGAAILATELVFEKKVKNAFCCVRPPGHHALPGRAMGFCFFNNVAVGAAHALAHLGVKRVAVCDFDVHHGNGTQDIFEKNQNVMVCSSFQHPFYPYTPLNENHPTLIDAPLPSGCTGEQFKEIIAKTWFPALERFQPEMLFISAGFDAHTEDEMSHTRLREADFMWITEELIKIAQRFCNDRVVSLLEGGYDLSSLGRSAAAHVKVLMNVH
jgi:acetoin utilization deacetylase AcuC-like enzyme